MRDFIAKQFDLDVRDAAYVVALAGAMLADDRHDIVIQRIALRGRKGELWVPGARWLQLNRAEYRMGSDKQPAAGVLVSEEIVGTVDKSTTLWAAWSGEGPPPPPRWDPRTRAQFLRDALSGVRR